MSLMTTSSTMTALSTTIELDDGSGITAVTLAANGEHLVVGTSTSIVTRNGKYLSVGSRGVRLLQVEDGKEIARIEAMEAVNCFSVSKDGKLIAAGTISGNVFAWDTKTLACETVATYTTGRGTGPPINAVHFSPDSTRLVVGMIYNNLADVYDVATRKRVQTLHTRRWVNAAKYSPHGNRIATATCSTVHVWDSNDGHLLVNIKVGVSTWYNTGLLWFNNHLFVLSDGTIRELDASSGLSVSEWPVPVPAEHSCISLPQHGKFIAYSSSGTVTFWDTSTHAQLGLIQHPQAIRSIAHSPDGRFLVISGGKGKITTNDLSRIIDSIPLSRLHPTFGNLTSRLTT